MELKIIEDKALLATPNWDVILEHENETITLGQGNSAVEALREAHTLLSRLELTCFAEYGAAYKNVRPVNQSIHFDDIIIESNKIDAKPNLCYPNCECKASNYQDCRFGKVILEDNEFSKRGYCWYCDNEHGCNNIDASIAALRKED